MTHLSGETSGSDRDFGSPEDLLPDSYPEEVTLTVRTSSSCPEVALPGLDDTPEGGRKGLREKNNTRS